MTVGGLLFEMFEYDRWANGQWLEAVMKRDKESQDLKIFQHIMAAQQVWLERVRGKSLTAMPTPMVSAEVLQELHEGWLAAVREFAESDPLVSYRRTTGEANRMRFRRIARHVVNHGTYHRGELRGLCRARGDVEFPETDLAGYYFHAGIAED